MSRSTDHAEEASSESEDNYESEADENVNTSKRGLSRSDSKKRASTPNPKTQSSRLRRNSSSSSASYADLKKGGIGKPKFKGGRQRRSSSDDDYLLFSKAWRDKDRRERRFTRNSFYQLHEKAEEILRGQKLRDHDREERLQEMADALDEMQDYMNEYKNRKDLELKKDDAKEPLAKNWKKYPKPGSKPKVTFKPEKFIIKQGWLYKKGIRTSRWYKRFFRIFLDDPHSLFYYSSPQKAERDSRMPKTERKGKKVNLLFANVNIISKYGRFHKQVHNNKNIIRDFEFFIQTKTVKKINSPNAKVKTRTVLGRVFFLCCLSENDTRAWVETLKYIEDQTDSCIREHQEKIKQGIELKRIYLDSVKNEGKIIEKKEEDPDIIDEQKQKKWDRAQMITAYGVGVSEGVAGKKSKFLIQDNYKAKRKTKKGNDRLDWEKLTVVLESNELHYDIEVFEMDEGTETKYFCEYLPTRRGEYELSILYDGCDIYGSPFKVKVQSSPASSSHSFLSGEAFYINPMQREQVVLLNLRNQFDEKVGIRDGENVVFKVEAPQGINVINAAEIEKEGLIWDSDILPIRFSFDFEYVKTMLNENSMWTGYIAVKMDDQLSIPSFLRNVKNSPFAINLVLQGTQIPQAQSPIFNSSYTEIPIGDIPTSHQYHEEQKRVDPPETGYGYQDYFTQQEPQPNLRYESVFSPSSSFSQSPLRETMRDNRQRHSSAFEQPKQQAHERKRVSSKILALFEKHETVLRTVYEVYAANANAVNALVELGTDYDFIPTFISKKEVKDLVQNDLNPAKVLEYEEFLFCLTQIAIISLSKPMFSHLYSTDKSKVNVLLNMWGLADASKISSFRAQK